MEIMSFENDFLGNSISKVTLTSALQTQPMTSHHPGQAREEKPAPRLAMTVFPFVFFSGLTTTFMMKCFRLTITSGY